MMFSLVRNKANLKTSFQALSSTLHMTIFAYGASAKGDHQNLPDISNIGVTSRDLKNHRRNVFDNLK
jgi:hypothetical protein